MVSHLCRTYRPFSCLLICSTSDQISSNFCSSSLVKRVAGMMKVKWLRMNKLQAVEQELTRRRRRILHCRANSQKKNSRKCFGSSHSAAECCLPPPRPCRSRHARRIAHGMHSRQKPSSRDEIVMEASRTGTFGRRVNRPLSCSPYRPPILFL